MRPFLTLLIAVVLMAGIFAYTRFAESVRPEPVQYVADFSKSKYSVRLHRTFDCAANTEFQINTSLALNFKDTRIERKKNIPSTEQVEFELPGVEVGTNSIYVTANLPTRMALDFENDENISFNSFQSKAHAMQIELLQDGNVVEQETFWIASGLNSVSGTLHFEIAKESEAKETHE
ncbi:hypothetical protein OAG68_02010 [bacterium]|nr:hypothetical protein [bacterium]